MPPQSAFPPFRHSLDFARKRDERICWLLGRHPVTAAMLVRLKWFPNADKAVKRLRRLARKGRIRVVGTVCRKRGRPEYVYCRWRPKPDQLLHEVQLTELSFRIQAQTFDRGPHTTDEHIRPDAELRINGRVYYLELDRGTMGFAQIEERFRRYEGCEHFSLWICSTRERMEAMRRRAERLRHTALFTTFMEALASPHGEIWLDFGGGRASLPRDEGKKDSSR